MDGSSRARLVVLVATLACGLTLAAAALVSTSPPSRTGGPDTIVRTPVGVRTAGPVILTAGPADATVGAPRTTPPPTHPGVGTPPLYSITPPAASTVGRS